MKKYNIVLLDNKDFVLTSCPSLETAQKRLKEMLEIDKKLAKCYKWSSLPKYEIIESEN